MTLSVALAYLTYALAEAYLHVSGVVVVVAGLVFGTIGRLRVGAKEWQSVSAIWTQLGFWASSLVFVLASMLVPDTVEQARPGDLLLLAALLVGALSAARSAHLRLPAVVRVLLRQRPIDARYKLVILWGGVRGAVTLALALAVSQNVTVPTEVRREPRCSPPASCCSPCSSRRRRCARSSAGSASTSWTVRQVLRARALALTQGEILDRLSETAIVHGLDLEAAEEVGSTACVPRRWERGLSRARRCCASSSWWHGTITTREAGFYADEMTEGHDLPLGGLDPAQPDRRPAGRDQGGRRAAIPARRPAPEHRARPGDAAGRGSCIAAFTSASRWPGGWPTGSSCA